MQKPGSTQTVPPGSTFKVYIWHFLILPIFGLFIQPVCAQQGTPLSLSDGLQMAFERNLILQMAQADLQKAQEQVRETTADLLPQLNVSLTYNRNWLLPSFVLDTPAGRQRSTFGTHNNVDGVLSLRQPLFSGGKIVAARNEARLFSDITQEEVRATRQQVQAEVEIAFYNAKVAHELLRVNRLALERTETNLQQVKELRSAGRVSGYELLRAQVQVASLHPDLIRAQNDLAIAEVAFKNIIGMDQSRHIELTGGFQRLPHLDGVSLEDLIHRGLSSRPEMRQLGSQLEMRAQSVKIARAASWPTIDLLASSRLQIQSNTLDFNQDDVSKSWFSGLSIAFPVFDGFRTRARVAKGKADLRRAELERQQLERNIRVQIRQAWLALKAAKQQMEAESQVVVQAQQGLTIAEARYKTGVGTQLELIDAQLVLTQSEAQYAQAQRDRAVALVHLEQAVGVLGKTDKK